MQHSSTNLAQPVVFENSQMSFSICYTETDMSTVVSLDFPLFELYCTYLYRNE